MRSICCYLLFVLLANCMPAQNRHTIDSLLNILHKGSIADTTQIYAYMDLSAAWSGINADSEAYYNSEGLAAIETCLKKCTEGSKDFILFEIIKTRLQNQKAWSQFLTGNVKEALELYKNSLALSDPYTAIKDPVLLKKVNRARALTYLGMGPCYSTNGDYKTAEQSYFKAIKLFVLTGDSIDIGTCYGNMGIDYDLQGLTPKALEYHYKGLAIKEKTGNKQDIAFALVNISNIHKEQKDFDKALKLYFRALDLNSALKNKRLEANLYGNIGGIYNDLKDHVKGLEYNQKALLLNTELKNKFGQAINCNSLGNTYDAQKSTEKALEYYYKALELELDIDYKDGQAVTYYNIGRVYLDMKKYKDAESYLNKALILAEETNSLPLQYEVHKKLSEMFDRTNHTALAYKHYKSYILFRDSVNNKENARQETTIELNHEFEKQKAIAKVEQDKKDALSAEEKRNQQFVIIGISIGLLLALVLAIVIFKSLRDNQKKNRIIQEQKEAVEIQKHLIEEKHKEITDSINYAERIQRSFLAADELLQNNLKDFFVLFLPKDVVSGDFYWAAKLSNGSFAYVTADSTGHGVPGAIMSILNISSLEKAIETESSPAAILNKTRTIIIDRLKKDGSAEGGKDGMDCSLVVLDPQLRHFSYAAANNPIWVVRNGGLLEYKGDKMPVGKHDRDGESFSENTVVLEQGDIIYTLTDGMPDQFGGEKGKKYLYRRLKDFLISVASLPMQEQKQVIQREFANWKQSHEQIDDVTLIGLRIS